MPSVGGTNFGTVTAPPANAQPGDRMQFATAPNVDMVVISNLGNGFCVLTPISTSAVALPLGWTSTRPVSTATAQAGPG